MADHVDDIARLLRQQIVHDVDSNVLIRQTRPWRAQQEDDAEQHPLQLEPRVGRHVEYFSDGRISGGDQHGDQDQPARPPSDPDVDSVDDAARLEEYFHDAPLLRRARGPAPCGPAGSPGPRGEPALALCASYSGRRSRRQPKLWAVMA